MEKSVGSINTRRNKRKSNNKNQQTADYYKKQIYMSAFWPITIFIVIRDVLKVG